MALAGSYNLKWHGHGVHINSSISGLYSSDSFTDVMLATTDGRYSSAHQFVLSACSPYLHKMFLMASSRLKTTAKIVIVLPSEISHSILTILLQYIYRGEAIVNHEQLPSIMKAAELLQIRGLCQGIEKPDQMPNSVINQVNKTNSDRKSNPESLKLSHRVLIPEVKLSTESGNLSINCINSVNQNSSSTTNVISRALPLSGSSPERKTLKLNHINKSLPGQKKDNDIQNTAENMIEKMVVGEEILVKEEPIDWEEQNSVENNCTVVKQELVSEEEIAVEVEQDSCYVPLTCDLCQETFTSPALWVRHIENTHPTTALASGKHNSVDDATEEYPLLHCELCQQVFSVPAEWVRHIHSHTEQQLETTHDPVDVFSQSNRNRVSCNVCGKMLQSQASMQIHARTHTGERPYLCKVCGREFNVKSNYLRHLRTLHEQCVNSGTTE